jgi:flagellar hook-length control protein FliK
MQKRPNHGSTGFLQTASESNANAATLTKQTEMPLSLVEPSSSKSPKAEYFSAAQNKENGAEQNLQQPAASAAKPKFTAEQPVFVSQLGEGGVAEKPLVETSSLTGISEAPMPVAAKTYADTSIHRPEMARHVAQQLADVAKHMPNRPIELSLNPEELGRVRMTFTINETGINIAVLTERGETMDILRRNIETLAQEFRELGHKDVNFNFSSNSQKNDEQNSDDSDAGNSSEIEHLETDQLEPARISLGQMNGLDIRL